MAFLFGVAQSDRLSARVLVRLLGDLGIGDSAARGLLARMRTKGELLAVERRGRSVTYQPGGSFGVRFQRLRSYQAPTAQPWLGHFHAILYQIPESERPFRDRLRRLAQQAGYGSMQQGLLIAAADLSEQVADVIDEAPAGCTVQLAELAVSVTDAAAIARATWGLEDVAVAFRAHIAALTGVLDDEPRAATADALRRMSSLLLGPQIDRLSDPHLPAELLPADWPGGRLLATVAQVRDRYLPPAHDYVRSVIAAG